ncbi:DciA family protein [Candidatus Vallotiella sp. (ex Adelges kitamiensis)]|uniref:DciA family protein n=1 Tax=Candidatus Vallotiella sp. (ex Adelges kitamiensis) TaxID=2864217 RepID=UPI001CE2E313|nr:DciA family protein [Candidatus Vallotia sp. (ex Adelges kitamiensis)]
MLKPFTELITSSAELEALQAGVQQVTYLESALRAVLPSYLVSYVYASPIKSRVLTIFVAHSALAARFRHLAPTVLAKLQQHGFELLEIKIRVRPQAHASGVKVKMARVSSAGVYCLHQLVNALEVSPLRQAIDRMARRHAWHPPQ